MLNFAEEQTKQAAIQRRLKRRQKTAAALFYSIITAFILALVGGGWYLYVSSGRQVTVTVTNEARVCSGNGNSTSCEYLVYTTGGTFKDTDSLLSGKFSSSDLYGQLINGDKYTFQVRGWRIPIFSKYPNILRIVSGPEAK
jgi:hypothetical protein